MPRWWFVLSAASVTARDSIVGAAPSLRPVIGDALASSLCASVQRTRAQNAVRLMLYERVAFTRELLELWPVENGDLAAHILDCAEFLQLTGSGRDAFTTHA